MVRLCGVTIVLCTLLAVRCSPYGSERQRTSNDDKWDTVYLTYDELQALEDVVRHESQTSGSQQDFRKQKIAFVRPRSRGITKRSLSGGTDQDSSVTHSGNLVHGGDNEELVLSFIGSPSDESSMMPMTFHDTTTTGRQMKRCSLAHSSFDSKGLRESSPKYHVEMRLPANYSNQLLMSLHSGFVPYQQPELADPLSICNYSVSLGKTWDASARALCPFHWVFGKPNRARLPERLMEARCSCQLAMPIYQQTSNCVLVRQKIPVLWRVGCKDGVHVYRQGYEYIPVACEPAGYLFKDGLPSHSMAAPSYSS